MSLVPDLPAINEIQDMATHGAGGRPEHTPTKESRALVTVMKGYGMPEKDVALVIGIAVNTMKKHYPEELATAKARMDLHAYQSVYRAIAKGKTDILKLYLERQCGDQGWKADSPVNVAQLPPVVINVQYVATKKDDAKVIDHAPRAP